MGKDVKNPEFKYIVLSKSKRSVRHLSGNVKHTYLSLILKGGGQGWR